MAWNKYVDDWEEIQLTTTSLFNVQLEVDALLAAKLFSQSALTHSHTWRLLVLVYQSQMKF